MFGKTVIYGNLRQKYTPEHVVLVTEISRETYQHELVTDFVKVFQKRIGLLERQG